jgi:AcrR family transcriptional regulator
MMRSMPQTGRVSRERDPVHTLTARGEETRARILEAATQLFFERGFEATSVSAIARAADVSVQALYWHYGSKADICYAFLQGSMDAFTDAILGEPDEGTPVERLRRDVRNYVLIQIRFRETSTAFEKLYTFGQLSTVLDDEQRERLVDGERRVIERLRTILRDGKAAGVFAVSDVKLAAFAIATACEYAFEWYDPNGRLSAEEVAEEYADLMESLAVGGRAPRSAAGGRALRGRRVRGSAHASD